METYYIDYLYWEISLEEEDIETVPEIGQADNACSIIAEKEYVKEQFKDVPFSLLKDTVYKLCDKPDIKTRKDAIMFFVWLAALDIKEHQFFSQSSTSNEIYP